MKQEVGKSTAGDRLKRQHRKLVKQENYSYSLKHYAETLIQLGDKEKNDAGKDAKDWLEAKTGALDLKRDKKTVDRITAEKIAKKATRGKKK